MSWPTQLHDCGDPLCLKNGQQTCALCDDAGPPDGSPARCCSACRRGRERIGLPEGFRDPQPCLCGGRWPTDGRIVSHSSPGCAEFAHLNGDEFVRLRLAAGRPN